MKFQGIALLVVTTVVCCVGLWAQRTADFGFGDNESTTNLKAEFYWSRLAYSPNLALINPNARHGQYRSWSRDYPKADRQFLIAMHRLTRIDGRPTEQVVTLNSNEIFNYPWIYAVQVELVS